jgi:hypothetical protein
MSWWHLQLLGTGSCSACQTGRSTFRSTSRAHEGLLRLTEWVHKLDSATQAAAYEA